MAVVTLDRIWIHDGANLASFVTADAPEARPTLAVGGRIAAHAGGRLRLITTAARVQSLPLALEQVSKADVATLESWAGKLLLLRTSYGLLMWGAFLDVGSLWRWTADAESVTLTFSEVTYSIAV